MITGYNTDVEHNGRIYHIQTEDKGAANPVVESLIYVGGEILASRRSLYGDLLQSGLDEQALSEKMEAQHRRMIMDVRQGKYDPEGLRPFGAGIISDRGFEEVVLEYLTKEMGTERLQLELDPPVDFVEGQSVVMNLRARGEFTSLPVAGAKIVVELITPVDKPRILAEGRTNGMGLLSLPLMIPFTEEGTAAVLLQASDSEESVELKWLVAKADRRRGSS